MFKCPLCEGELRDEGGRLLCSASHSFDKARSGYVNLLLPSKMNSKLPGDPKEMVYARKNFLNRGYYAPLRETLARVAGEYAPASPAYLDVGCGTGYYTSGVIDALTSPNAYGIDISKFAADVSAKSEKRCSFAVASAYDLPFGDSSFDILTNVFSPMASEECVRVMKSGARLIYVVPAERHLYSLKELIYVEPYENPVRDTEYEALREVERIPLSFDMHLNSAEDTEMLFSMTPYFWRSPEGALEKIRQRDEFDTTAEFYILVYECVK